MIIIWEKVGICFFINDRKVKCVFILYFFVILYFLFFVGFIFLYNCMYFLVLYKIMENDLEESFLVMGRNNVWFSCIFVILFINYVIYWNVYLF